MSAIVPYSAGGLLRVEEARDLLAECKRVDEVKEVRDRAAAVQAYARQKRAGHGAANDAGTIVVYAVARLAEMYRDASDKRRTMGRASQCESKADIEAAAETERALLIRWEPLANASSLELDSAIERVIDRGNGVTPTAVLRALTATSEEPGYDGDEWYTPQEIVEAARAVLGEIDLDPASNAHAQKTIRAVTFHSKEDDGLSKPWAGRVFCNPPYSYPLVERFTHKLIEEWKADRVTAAIYLVNNCTDAAWCQLLLRLAPVCLTAGRLDFMQKNGAKFATRQGQAIFYLGERADVFAQEFDKIGTVVARLPA